MFKPSYVIIIILLLAFSLTSDTSGQDIFSFGNRGTVSTKKNVILIIGDGMGYTNEIAASRYLYGTDNSLAWHNFEYRGWATTWDIDTYNRYASHAGAELFSPGRFNPSYGYDVSRGGAMPYGLGDIPDTNYFFSSLPTAGGGSDTYAYPSTDSAASATAIATGQKTDSGNVAWAAGDPPDGQLTSIAEFYRELLGSAIGFVTTVEFSHCTPSPFFAHHTHRGYPGPIGVEMITETKPEVIIGGGHPTWESDYISWSNVAMLKMSEDYVYVERTTGIDGGQSLLEAARLAVSTNMRLFGLYGGAKGCFNPYEPHDTPGTPGFSRSNENPTLAQAVEAALTVLSEDPDGFFLLVEQGDLDWSNHYRDYYWMIGAMHDLDMAVKQVVDYIDRPGDDIDWSNTLVLVTSDHVCGALRLSDDPVLGAGDLPAMNGTKYHYTFPDGEAHYTTTVHTNEPVMVYARGPVDGLFTPYEGLWYPGTRLIDNTQLFSIMVDYAGFLD